MKQCACGREMGDEDKFCERCGNLPKDENGMPRWRYCPCCKGIVNGGGNGHYVPPCGGDDGFFTCGSFLSQKPEPD
jgi:hypothetical protein